MFRTWFLLLAMVSLPVPALAHVDLDDPPMRSGGDQKQNPCANASPSATRTEYVGGSTITVSWRETINHPGYFLISLDPDGSDFDGDGDGVGDHPESPNVAGFSSGDGSLVLLRVEDTNTTSGATISAEVTLPDIDCDQCTLQLIQMMSDKTPTNARPTDHIYFRCADIKIVGTGAGPGPDEPVQAGGAPGAGGEGNEPGPSGAAGAGGSESTAGGSSGDVVPTSTAVPIPVPTAPQPSEPTDPNPPTAPTSPPAATTTPAPTTPAPTTPAQTTPAQTSTPTAPPTGTNAPGVGGAPGAVPPAEETSSGGDDGGCSFSAVPRTTSHSAWLVVLGALWAVRRRVRAVPRARA